MPTLRLPVSGFFVKTSGSVMKGPPSSGQHFKIGRMSSDGLSISTTSWHGAFLTYFGKFTALRIFGMSVTRSILFASEIFGRRMKSRRSSAISSRLSTPKAMLMRSMLPKAFMSTGMS